ncbi:MAG: 1-acyl-sn-glycerol-3-phosphate acyltransferase [Gammaproteobacteria bacterium]|nr:1-acyl-sn-glycerol-3-phosphate acyltransferase [Gammaproteobacteria bacterium]MBU1656198.1 1-acyl-sn-glycerol-3-phosphate acyltransferase [Gammaproteobacteria bacterium]MBU1959763.1 1-acyl-sn-glycerol-3-phosphate acyltransferase [Gammaproteobacteria bacterium]
MIIAVRSFIYILLLGITVFIYASAIILVAPFTSYLTASRIATAWGRLNITLLRFICGIKLDIQGWDRLPQGGGYIIMAKHQSAWETVALRGLLPFNQSWILKKELLLVPFFGLALKLTKQIAIDRKAGKMALKQLLQQGIESLENKRIVIVFPEGTRVRVGQTGRYNIGGALLAEKSGCLVVPVAHNAGIYWPRNGFRKYPGTINVVIGEPFSSVGMTAAEINNKVSQWIESNVAELPHKRA